MKTPNYGQKVHSVYSPITVLSVPYFHSKILKFFRFDKNNKVTALLNIDISSEDVITISG
jgi:hypothetical protein